MATVSQQNKKEMLTNIKDMIVPCCKKGLVHLSKTSVVALEGASYLAKVEGTHNMWYRIADVDISLLEVTPDYYKLVSSEDVASLDEYNWTYDGKNVLANVSDSDDSTFRIVIERAVLNIDKYGCICVRDTEQDAHHMWMRLSALPDMLKSIDRTKHIRSHRIIGNYDRSQCVEINGLAEFERFTQEIVRVRRELVGKQFSMEF